MSNVTAPTPVSARPAADLDPVQHDRGWFTKKNFVATILTGYIPLFLATMVVALPLLWMVLSSFKGTSEIITLDLHILPSDPGFHNYREAFASVPFARIFFNSVFVTAVGASIKVILAIMTAYALVFVRFPFKNVIFIAILVALMVPSQVAILPNYILIASFGWLNTYQGIIVPSLGTAFGTFLLRQQFLSLPKSMLEAAEVEGAGHWRRLWQIVVPVSVPSIATVGLVTIVSEWNDYIWPLIITTDPNLMTLPVGLTLLQNSESGPQGYGVMMAGAVIVLVPVLLVFAMLQRYIVAGLTQGSVAN
jgi:sn-glycerol 3-phosphate transport system permease protein